MGPVRILLCDDHEVVRLGLAELLTADPDFSVVGEASTAAEAIAMSESLKPDLVVADVRMPDGSGIEACRTIRERHPGTKVLMLTSFADEDALMAAVVAGAAGYVLKQSTAAELLQAIKGAAEGKALLDPRLVANVFERIRKARGLDDPGFASLTDQERRILALVAEGKSNKEIGAELTIAEKTVKNHMSHILDKMGLHRRAEVAAYMAKRQALD